MGTRRRRIEKPAMVAVAAEAAELFAATCASERRALYVVSANAGFASSLAFWAGRRREGVALAGPALFPWTLAERAVRLARPGVRCTWTERHAHRPSRRSSAALHQCWLDLDDRQADVGWIVAVDFAAVERRGRGVVRGDAVSSGSGPARLERSPTTGPSTPLRASAALARVLADAASDGCRGFSDGQTAWP